MSKSSPVSRSGRFAALPAAEVARFTGIPVKRTLVTVYALNGFAAVDLTSIPLASA